MTGARARYLVAYDIADPRRLKRVHAYLKTRATPLQFSLFLAHMSDRDVARMTTGLARRIDPRYDDVRIYRLPKNARIATLGRPMFADGIYLPDAGVDAAGSP